MGGGIGKCFESLYNDYVDVLLIDGSKKSINTKHLTQISRKEYNRISNLYKQHV